MGRVLVSASHFDTLCKEAWELLESHGHEVVFDKDRPFPAYSYEEMCEILPTIDTMIVGLDLFDEKALAISERFKGAAKFGTGVDNFDLAAATRLGKIITNCPGQNSNAVAELTIGFIFGLLRHVVALDDDMRNHKWTRFIGEELEGKTVGLYGFGAISKLVSRKLSGMGVNIIAYDLFPNEEAARELNVRMVSLDEVIETSDILSLHAPATDENHHIFNSKTFSRMKDGAYLINAARGALVDLDELAEAMKAGKIAGAALDAFEVEPLPEGTPILSCDNVILTPHTGSESAEAYHRTSMMAAQNCIDIMEKGYCERQVNK